MRRLAALCVGLLALSSASRPATQQRALDVVLDYFHRNGLVQSVFKEQAVLNVSEEVLHMGTFVQLRVELAQTHCRKQQRRTHNCLVKPGGRRQTCLACIKFDASSAENVLDRLLQCRSPVHAQFQEMSRKHSQECEKVRNAHEDRYLPGRFAFSVGAPS
ncbi:Retinoic acid receptor responder protein 2 [Varanus komodoensis]|uniref:retinoic acid receptor responder protein 2 n=1 Tax=Varanus komodoensis TaxID=61221 RepID=UPI001CF7C9DF|nr:retinoic acid receptor responder protein 2 [Varanus komodoensis]KAF7236257.1 Retinoic acid receptor responder protein 2 [Varanus komodoensis]